MTLNTIIPSASSHETALEKILKRMQAFASTDIGINDVALAQLRFNTARLELSSAKYNLTRLYAANGVVVSAYVGIKNRISETSILSFTPVSTDGTPGATVSVIPTPHSTARKLARAINDTEIAKASAFTVVRLRNFNIPGNDDSLTIGINHDSGENIPGPVLNSEFTSSLEDLPEESAVLEFYSTYSQVATAINSHANMQLYGIYAIAGANCVYVISPTGYDITVTSSGTATLGEMQLLNSANNPQGVEVGCAAGSSICAPGILSVVVREDVVINFNSNNTNLFDSNLPTVTNCLTNQPLDDEEQQSFSTMAIIKNVSSAGTISFNLVGNNIDLPIQIIARVTPNNLTQLVFAINQATLITGIDAQTYDYNSIILTALVPY